MHEPLSIPAIRGKMGNWIYYSCVMPMSELARRVNFAKEIFPNPGLSEMVQRKLSGERADEICRYLTEREDRFFNSLVVAFYKGPPTWFSGAVTNQRTSDPTNSFDVEDIRESGAQFGVLQFKGSETLFALDGQHKLAGIKVAQSKTLLPVNDCVPVIFVAHSDNQSGIRRSRELFTTLNKEAKKVGVGDIIALDENDPAEIVTRMIVEGKTGLSGGKIAYKQTESIDPRTDLNCITTIANIYFSCLNLFKDFHYKTKTIRKIAALPRPEDAVIQKLLDLENRYFAAVGKCFPEFGEAINATTGIADVIAKNRGSNGGHLLFRPVGITILTKLVCQIKADRPNLSIEKCVKQVSAIPVNLDAPHIKMFCGSRERKRCARKVKRLSLICLLKT
jgi:DNA sulfur modification protein DndB